MTPPEQIAVQIEVREVQGLEASSPCVAGVVVDGQLIFVAKSIVTENPVRVAHLPQDAALSIAVLNAGAKACTGPLTGPAPTTTGPLPLAVMRSNAVPPPPDEEGLPPHSLTWLGWFPLTPSAGGQVMASGARVCLSLLFEGAALLAPCVQQQQPQTQWQQQPHHHLGPAALPPVPPPNFTASPSFGPPNSDIVWPWFDDSAHDLPLLDAPELEQLLAPTPPGSRPPSPPRTRWPDSGSRPPSPERPERPDSRPPSPPRPDRPNSRPPSPRSTHMLECRPPSPCRSEKEISFDPQRIHNVPEIPPLRPLPGGALARTRAGTSSALVEAEIMHSVLGRLYAQLVQAASGGLIHQWAGTFDALVTELMQGGGCRDMSMLAQQEASSEIDLTRDHYPSSCVQHGAQHAQHSSVSATL